jgi:hypothetical protein
MTIYFHIGLGKTGSTSIQAFLEVNQEKLKQNNFIVPTTVGRKNHRRFAMYAQDDHVINNLRKAKGYTTVEKVHRFRAGFREQFLAEAKDWPQNSTILLSSEQTSQLRTASSHARLLEILQATGHNIKIIMYFRRQDSMAVSEYSQFIKGGRLLHLQEAVSAATARKTYNYYATAKAWSQTFGIENIIVRPFERSQFKGGDVVLDYLSIIGINEIGKYTPVDEQNRSLDIYTIEYLRHLNQHISRWATKGRNLERVGLAEILEEISNGPKPKLSSEQITEFMAHFEESNSKLAREFMGRADGRLFTDDVKAQDETVIPELTVDRAMEITAMLWVKLKTLQAEAQSDKK